MATAPHTYNGISVRFTRAGGDRYGWAASITFHDGAHCAGYTAGGPISTEGTLHTTYAVESGNSPEEALAAAVRAITSDADRMGIGYYMLRDPKPPLWADGPGWTTTVINGGTETVHSDWDDDAPISETEARAMMERFPDTWDDAPTPINDPLATGSDAPSEWDAQVRAGWQRTADRWDPETLSLRASSDEPDCGDWPAPCNHDPACDRRER